MAIKKRFHSAASSYFPNFNKPGDDEGEVVKIKGPKASRLLLTDPSEDQRALDKMVKTEANKALKASAEDLEADVDFDQDLDINSISDIDASAEEDDLEASSAWEDGLDPINAGEDDDDEESDDDDEEDFNPSESDGLVAGEDLVDIDATEDDIDASEIDIVTTANKTHIIFRNRIIATMTKTAAITANKQDIYLDDRFASLVATEIQAKGLRRGLTSMGFLMAKVDLSSKESSKSRIEAHVRTTKERLEAQAKKSSESFEQSLALAAVGMNKSFFKDVQNPIATAFTRELSMLGVKGSNKVVAKVMEYTGVEYARSLVALATKLSAMPEETRNALASALDMTASSLPVEATDEDDDGEPTSVESALLRPFTASAQKPARSLSVSDKAQAILAGSAPLFG